MKRNYVRCKACHNFIEKDANFCPQCGARNKEPFYKKWWFWVIVTMLIVSFASGGESEEPERITRDTSKRDYTQSVSTTEETEPSAESTTEATAIPTTEVATEPTTEPAAVTTPAVDLLLGIINTAMEENFEDYSVTYDDCSITVSIVYDGLADNLAVLKLNGYDETYSDWVSFREAMVALCVTNRNAAKELGLDNYLIYVNIPNDKYQDNTLLMIVNGAVLYDVMAE